MDNSVSQLFEGVKARLNEQCDDYRLWKVSRMVVTTPDQFGACLRLPYEVAVQVSNNYNDYRDKIYNLLVCWRRRLSNHRGTWADLVKLLSQLSEQVLLEGVRDLLKEEDSYSVAEKGLKYKDVASSLDSGIGRDLRASTSGSESALYQCDVVMSKGEHGDAPPTSYSSFATCSSLSSVETDSSMMFPNDPSAPSDPYPSLQLGTQFSSSAFDTECSGVVGDLVPVCNLAVYSSAPCGPLDGGIATYSCHGDVSCSPPTVFYTPLNTLDEGRLNKSGCRAEPVMTNGVYRKQFSATVGSCSPPPGPRLPRSSHQTFTNSPAFMRHNSKSDGSLHVNLKYAALLTKLSESSLQVSYRTNQLKWRNRLLELKKQVLNEKGVALRKDNCSLQKEIEELEATNRYHHRASVGIMDAQVQRLMDELSSLHEEYQKASKIYADLTLECAVLEAQRDKAVGSNVRLQLQRNELENNAQLDMADQGQQCPPNVYQRQRSFSDSSIDAPHFDSFGPSSVEGHI